ncbi:polysaccharide pyruvyl transferase family protein [Cyclobacterium salsum]|uniref:polysaccharide pyruvyl transferase family protein n=1 Tax=Cyclobacterium salsum TaxID=2666329 RepID=UPI001F264E1B|nr:polysaccharide pyruvyl transferase family protein [Cyclobacterium salsum]
MDIKIFLSKYKGQHIYYKPNPGNGGDALIAYGAYCLFKQLGLNYTIITEETDLNNKIVFYAGGGNLVKEYDYAANFINDNLNKFKEFILLPHTINSNDELIKKLGSNATLICREEVSFTYVHSLNPACNYYLMEDLAFSISINELKEKLKKNIIPIFFRLYILRMFRYQRQVLSPIFNIIFEKNLNVFRIDSEKTNISRPKNNLDLSLLILYDGNMADEKMVEQNVIDIFSIINKYENILTNRLHICIAGALLGKDVIFYPNSYYKNESIFLFSLKENFSNVQWCNNQTIVSLGSNYK